MSGATPLRRYLAELLVVFIGVALAFAVDNLRDDLSDRSAGEQYLKDFRQDLVADLEMLQTQQDVRRAQLGNASIALEFFEGRAIDPQVFFEAYYLALYDQNTIPNRNTMDEVLSTGSLRLIRDSAIRKGLLDLYTVYHRIALAEAHMARDFDQNLYDPTFSSVRLQLEGPWPDTPANRKNVEVLLGDLRIENGLRLIVANLEFPEIGLLAELELARSQVEHLLDIIPAGD